METQTNAPGADASRNTTLDSLEKFFDMYLREKFPFQLPIGVKDFIVQYGPWITLVLLILGAIAIIPLALLALGLTAATLPFAAMAGSAHTSILGIISIIVGLAALVLQGLAIPGLMKRKLSGWKLAYYASLISAVSSLLSLSIFSMILGLFISMYILFQIRSYYK